MDQLSVKMDQLSIKMDQLLDIIKKNVTYLNLLETIKTTNAVSIEMIAQITKYELDEDYKYHELLEHLLGLGLYLFKDLILHTILPKPEKKYNYVHIEIENKFIDMLLIHDTKYELKPFDEKLLTYPNKKLNVIKSTKFHESYSPCMKVYSMRSKTRGILFLVNNINFEFQSKRWGAQYDKYYLISLYRGMGFKIFYFENLKAHEFYKYIDELIGDPRHLNTTDCLVLALLTHGNENNEAIFYDNQVITIEGIIRNFSDTNCPSLKGKPKIFLFPFCRGLTADVGITHLDLPNIQTDGISRNYLADMIICYGSIDGYQTLRDPLNGSWFVPEFCIVLAEQAHEKDFETMLYDVKQRVMGLRPKDPRTDKENYLQTPSIVLIDFNKLLYFNPGYTENN